MKKVLILSALFFLISFVTIGQTKPNKKCHSAKAEAKVEWSESGRVSVSVVTTNYNSPVNYIFFNEKGARVGEDIRSNEIEGLVEGKYFCVLNDRIGCSEMIEFEVTSKPENK